MDESLFAADEEDISTAQPVLGINWTRILHSPTVKGHLGVFAFSIQSQCQGSTVPPPRIDRRIEIAGNWLNFSSC